MKLLRTILRAAHCRSTHHFFAIDALPIVSTERGTQLSNLLLNYYQDYLTGAKDPDTKFRDFKNHVIHVQDQYWGGAAKAAVKWYDRSLQHLNQHQWAEAAYAIGVLSHYFTDPLMPLHTAQSEREKVVHRPMEWSVCKAYSLIHHHWSQGTHRVTYQLSEKRDWLSDAIHHGAAAANQFYDELIDRYDLVAGAKSPIKGLDQESIEILAGVFGIALTGWAKIIERIADDTPVRIPTVSLLPATVISSIKIPTAWVVRRIESNQERAVVKAIFDEFDATGTVNQNLPEEIRTVRAEKARWEKRKTETSEPTAPVRRTDTAASKPPIQAEPSIQQTDVNQAVATDSYHSAHATEPDNTSIPIPDASSPKRTSRRRQPRLKPSDKIVHAPSIGRKTAKRFHQIGIDTVGDFLAASPGEMAYSLRTRWIREKLLMQWQAQAQLVCNVASLCGYKAQLLVAIGVDTADQLAKQDLGHLYERMSEFAATSAGKRILRSSKTPPESDVQNWIQDAKDIAVTQRIA